MRLPIVTHMRTLAALALALITTATSNASAAPRDAEQLRWADASLTLAVHGDAWSHTDINAAITAWSSAQDGPTITRVDGDADITLTADPLPYADTPSWVGAEASWTTDHGYITTCTIAIGWSRAGKDATMILTHELGHCLGLGHSDHGIMRAVLHKGDTITPADLSDLSTLYQP